MYSRLRCRCVCGGGDPWGFEGGRGWREQSCWLPLPSLSLYDTCRDIVAQPAAVHCGVPWGPPSLPRFPAEPFSMRVGWDRSLCWLGGPRLLAGWSPISPLVLVLAGISHRVQTQLLRDQKDQI